jgi:hypothetical protein
MNGRYFDAFLGRKTLPDIGIKPLQVVPLGVVMKKF